MLDITPEPSINNLRLLAATLTHPLNALLHTAGMPPGLPLSFGASLFSAIPTLPLITALGTLTVRLQSPSSPPTYQDLLSDASEAELDGVTIQAPTTEALLRSLSDRVTVRPGAPCQPPAAHERATMSLAGQSQPEHGSFGETEPEELVLSALAKAQGPLSIREILLRAPSDRKPPYKRVKAAAETLTDRGELDRIKEGTAHRYALRTDTDDQIGRRSARYWPTAPTRKRFSRPRSPSGSSGSDLPHG